MPSSPALTFAPGAVVGDRYRVEELIGQGGFGAVFRATQLTLTRSVALKILLPDLLNDEGLRRFRREAELVLRLEHPNVVRLLDFGSASDGSPFLVFEYLRGQTLEDAIRASRGMPPARVARIFAQILKALMEAHAIGIVHRDLKPANVYLSNFQGESDFVKVLDFGIAKGTDSSTVTQRGTAVGTPAYMAPEQLMGREATPASDLYSLGMMIAEAITGTPLFHDRSIGEIVREQTSPNPLPHLPEALKSQLGPVIYRATQKLVERRYTSAAEMLAHIEAVMGAAPGAFGSTGATPTSPDLARAGADRPGSLAYASTSAVPTPGAAAAQTASPHFNPLVPRPPGAPAPRRRGRSPWALAGIVGGGVALAAGVIVAGVAVSRGDGGKKKSGATTEDRGTWLTLISDDLVEVPVNGDRIPDLVGLYADPDERLCAFDGATFRSLWCKPTGADPSKANQARIGLVGRTIVRVDASGIAHLHDLGTGVESTAVRLGSRAEVVCPAPESPGKLWIKTEDNKGLLFDPAARSVSTAPRPESCSLRPRETSCVVSPDPQTCPARRRGTLFGIKGIRVADYLYDGNDGVGIGDMAPARQPVLFGLLIDETGHEDLRWKRPLISGDSAGGLRQDTRVRLAIGRGRAITAYEDVARANHLLCVDSRDGKTLWEVTSDEFHTLVVSPTRVYVQRPRRLDVRDAATGALLGGIGAR